MLRLFAALCLASSFFIALPLYAQNPLDAEDDDLDELIGEVEPQILFYLPLDGDSVGFSPDFKIRSVARDYDEELPVVYGDGLVGKAAMCFGSRHFLYPADDILDRSKGALSFWFKWNVQVKETPRGAELVNGEIALPDSGLLNSQDDEWHNYVVTWNAEKKQKRIYRDGKLVGEAAMPTPVKSRLVKLGWKCRGLLDEVYLFDVPLEVEAIQEAIRRAKQKQVSWENAKTLSPSVFRYPVDMRSAKQKRPRLPGTVDWELKAVARTTTSERFDLSGYWRVQPFGTKVSRPALGVEGNVKSNRTASLLPSSEEWAYSEFPGSWRPTGPSRQGGIRDSRLKPVGRWNDVDISFYPAAWLERDFVLGERAMNKGVFLTFEGVHDACDIYLNDSFIGSVIPWQVREFNVTHAVRRDGTNRVSIMAGRPYGTSQMKKRDGETVWLPSGLSLPVYLDFRKTSALSFTDVIPIPHFRQQMLGVEFWTENLGDEPRHLKAVCRITDTRSGKMSELPAATFTAAEGKREMKVLSFAWENPILWFPDAPHLLDLSLAVYERDQLIEETFPVRFGFREVWAEKGDFWMNGVPLRMQGQCHSFPGATYEQALGTIERLGLVGFRSSIAYFLGRDSMPQAATEATLKAADETGFLFNFKLYGGGTTSAGELRARRDYFRQFRSHPSAVCFSRLQYGYHGPAHGSPISLGRHVEKNEIELPQFKENQALVDLCHTLNPGSLVAYYQQGVVGDYRSYMQYLGYGTPVQTREEWPRYWASQRPAPFFGLELDICSNLYIWRWQKGFRTGSTAFAQGTPPLATEHAARYFGPDAYGLETRESVSAITAHVDKESEYDLRKSASADALKAFMIEQTTRAWRTYGISYLIHDDTKITYRPDLELSKSDLAYQKNNARFLAYIGGPSDDFVRKDHSYFNGEEVKRQIILVNGKFHSVDAGVQWRLVDRKAGNEVRQGASNVQVAAGEIFKLPMMFKMPAVDSKVSYTLTLEVKQEGETTRDELGVEAFPSPTKPSLGNRRLAVLDDVGDTVGLLERAGIDARRIVISGNESDVAEMLSDVDLFIIGRRSYRPDPGTVSAMFKAAEKGMNILCFEQVEKTVFGLKNDDPNTRHTFVSASDHPVLGGLSNEDFRNWRGASDILEPYPDYRKGIKYGLLEHKKATGYFGQNEFAHWSSNGTVASFHFEKPQTGAFRTLLSSGFDMLYTPLVELFPGNGKILLCQLDVTNRYGIDPVATRITNQLLKYATESRQQPARKIAWWGNSYWGEAFDELKVDHVELRDLKSLEQDSVVLLSIDSFSQRKKEKKETADQRAEKAAPLKVDILQQDDVDDIDEVDEFIGNDESPLKRSVAMPKDIRERIAQLASNRAVLTAFLEHGGTLVVPFVKSRDYVKWLPFKMKVQEKEIYRVSEVGTDILSGTSASDFFYREVLKLPVITELPVGSTLQKAGLFGSVAVGKGEVVFCQLYPELFHDAWQRTKVLRILSTMFTNLGVGMRAHQSGDHEKPLPDPFYSAPALDFNPDQHTSW